MTLSPPPQVLQPIPPSPCPYPNDQLNPRPLALAPYPSLPHPSFLLSSSLSNQNLAIHFLRHPSPLPLPLSSSLFLHRFTASESQSNNILPPPHYAPSPLLLTLPFSPFSLPLPNPTQRSIPSAPLPYLPFTPLPRSRFTASQS